MRYLSSRAVKKNLHIAWPLAINALLMQSMLMVDALLISPLGEASLAALGIATTLIAFCFGTQMALANGSQLLFSRAIGAKNKKQLEQHFTSALWINLASGVCFLLGMMVLGPWLVRQLSQESRVIEQALEYLALGQYLLLLNALTQVLLALFNADGKTKISLYGYLLEMPINAIASYFLIHGVLSWTGMGVSGAALGSLVAIVLRALYLVWRCQSVNIVQVTLPFPGWDVIYQHWLHIYSIAANVTLLSMGMSAYQLIYSQLPLTAYVAISLLFPWVRIGNQVGTAWAQASAICLSQRLGAGRWSWLALETRLLLKGSMWIACLSVGFFVLLSALFPLLYPDLAAETQRHLMVLAPLYILLPLARVYNTSQGHILRALGHAKWVFRVHFIGQWCVALPLCTLVVLYTDVPVFWAFAIFVCEDVLKIVPFIFLMRRAIRTAPAQGGLSSP